MGEEGRGKEAIPSLGIALKPHALTIIPGHSAQVGSAFRPSRRGRRVPAHHHSSPPLLHRLARPFARLAGGDASLLTITGMMSERAMQMKPDHAPYVRGKQGWHIPARPCTLPVG